jgi:hypothetical protein
MKLMSSTKSLSIQKYNLDIKNDLQFIVRDWADEMSCSDVDKIVWWWLSLLQNAQETSDKGGEYTNTK